MQSETVTDVVSASTDTAAIEVRPIEPRDADEGSRIIYEAFRDIHDYHRFPGAYPTIEVAAQAARESIDHSSIWGVAAVSGGHLLGLSFVDERGPIRGIGPVSVDPDTQGHGVGRRLMEALLVRSASAEGVRLLQDAFNRSSLALYASMGFEVRGLAVLVAGSPRSNPQPGYDIRPLGEDDIEECERLCLAVHGFERTNELRDALDSPVLFPSVAVRAGQICAYATTLTHFPSAYAVASSEQDMRALILGSMASDKRTVSFLVPAQQSSLLGWCLSEGMRIIKPMTYMTVGFYREPAGCWLPSVMY